MKKRRVLFLWSRYSGYMAACWKRLSAIETMDVEVVAIESNPSDRSDPTFIPKMLDGVTARLIPHADADDYPRLKRHLPDETPDVLVVSGWQHPGYVQAIRQNHFGSSALIVCSDNPIRHTWRQRLGILKIRWLLDRASRVMVPGDRGYQLMKSWKLPDEKIAKGLYGVDELSLKPCISERESNGWPKNFIFTGRYCQRKGVDIMLEAYADYRARHDDPWDLVCCGRGELGTLLQAQPGVIDRGFVQPERLNTALANASAFVLASRSDAWPLSLVEAAMAGLPIVCTAACGSSAELVRDRFNGRVVPTANRSALSDAMSWIHANETELTEFGRRSSELANAFSAHQWAERWADEIEDICRNRE